MLIDNIDSLIKTEMLKSRSEDNHLVLSTYRLIKSELVKAKTSGLEYNDAVELSVLSRMVKQREKSVEAYLLASREDLAEPEKQEIEIIKVFLPKLMSYDEIESFISEALHGVTDKKKVQGEIFKSLKGKADPKSIKEIFDRL